MLNTGVFFSERDLKKYMESGNPVREKRKKIICDLMEDPIYVPVKEKELAMLLQVPREEREELREILRELLAEGQLMLSIKGK